MKLAYQTNTWGGVFGHPAGVTSVKDLLYLANGSTEEAMRDIAAAWRPSLLAGFLGALASQFWFLAFAIATAASVRTLALVEVLFAQAISVLGFRQRTTMPEALGIVLIVVGVGLLISAS